MSTDLSEVQIVERGIEGSSLGVHGVAILELPTDVFQYAGENELVALLRSSGSLNGRNLSQPFETARSFVRLKTTKGFGRKLPFNQIKKQPFFERTENVVVFAGNFAVNEKVLDGTREIGKFDFEGSDWRDQEGVGILLGN